MTSEPTRVSFLAFSSIFGDFWPGKVIIGPIDPGFGGVIKVTKIDWTSFSPTFGEPWISFWRFLAFLGDFWRFLTRKSHIRPYRPRVWGGHKTDKSWYLDFEFWATFAQNWAVLMSKYKSSGNDPKMIVGLWKIFWRRKFWKIYLLWGSFWPPKEKYVFGHTQKICPNFFDFFSIFGKFMNWALIYGCGFGSYL